MKRLKRFTVAALALAVVATGVNLIPMHVSAGVSNVVVDNSSFAEELDSSKWHAASADVLVQGGKLVFTTESTGDTRLIATDLVSASEQSSTLFKADYTMKLTTLPAGEKFILGYSLGSVEAYYEEAGNLEVVFENNNGLKVSVVAYDEDGKAITLSGAQSVGTSLGSSFTVNVHATTKNHVSITVNGKTIYNKTTPIDMGGRIGFLQSGGCAAEVSSVSIISHRYDTPENPNIVEDFESGTININALSSRNLNSCGYFPCGIQVEEYNGSNVLMFRNANVGGIGTIYKYSNFEATFDVPYMQHTNVVDEEGNIIKPANVSLAFVIGSESYEFTNAENQDWIYAPDSILFDSNGVFSYKHINEGAFADLTRFYEKGTTQGYSIKITMIDTIVTVYMKALNAQNFEQVMSYKIGNATPTGHLQISSTGRSNFAIDNLKIVNKDKDAKSIQVDYKSGKATNIDDWAYEPMEVKYRDGSTPLEPSVDVDTDKVTDEKEPNVVVIEQNADNTQWYYLMAIAGVTAVVIIAVSVIATRKKRVGNGGDTHEEP